MIDVTFIVQSLVLIVWTYQLWQFLARRGPFYPASSDDALSRTHMPGEELGGIDEKWRPVIASFMGLSIVALAFIMLYFRL